MARAPMPAPQPLESPAIRRSAMLAKLLEEQRQPVEIRGGYGELAARLLGQGITQFGANRADRQVREERTAQMGSQRDALLAGLPPLPSASPAPGAALADALVPPPVNNTQEPIQAPIAPAASVAGSPMPPAAPAGVPAAPMPQAAPMPAAPPQAAPANPLGPTPQEIALIRQAAQSGDPGQLAWAQQTWGEIQMRMAQPAAERNEIVDRNGVSFYVDRAGVDSPRQVFEGSGVPAAAQADTFLAGEENEWGVSPGTLLQRSPNGVISVVNKPPEGTARIGGRVVNEPGFVDAMSERQRTTQNIELENRREQERPQFEARLGRIAETTTTIQEEVAYAQRIIAANPDAVGLIGSMAARVPGTPAHDLQKALESIGANIGFEYLQDMRNSNPTGGGVGALTDSERTALSSTAGSLAQSQSADRLNMSLGRISRLTQAGSDRARQMYDSTYRAPAPRQPAPRRSSPPSAPSAPRRSNGQTRRYNPNTGQLE